jgi:hypothetical protein
MSGGDLKFAVTLETLRLLEFSGAMDATTVGKPPIPTEAVEHGSTQQGTHTAGTDNGGVLPNPGTLVNRSGVSTMNITPQQKDLLIAIVKADQSGDGSPFIFVQHRSGRGLCYEDGRTVPVAADESDFVQLQRENLLTWVRVQGGLRGKPTQLGIETAASLRNKPAPSTATIHDSRGDDLRAKPSEELKLDESLGNPFPEDDPKHDALAPFFEAMEKFQVLSEEYPALSVEWRAEEAKWLPWPPPFRAFGEGVPCSPGSDLHLKASAGEAGQRLLGSPESWFDPFRDPWLDVTDREPWERWLYAIREFWLNAREEAEDAGADMREFAKAAEAVGYWPSHNPFAVGERVWRKMVKSKRSLQESMEELGLSTFDEIGENEEPAGWVQRGRIQHLFKDCAYFCGVLAARRVRGLEKVATKPIDRGSSVSLAEQPTGSHSGPDSRAAPDAVATNDHPGPASDGESQPHEEPVALSEPLPLSKLKTAKRRGRRGNQGRRDAIRGAIGRYGQAWRDHLSEILEKLDTENVPLGDFQQMEIDLGDGQTQKASKWEDLDFAEKDQRRQILDALRKYAD